MNKWVEFDDNHISGKCKMNTEISLGGVYGTVCIYSCIYERTKGGSAAGST